MQRLEATSATSLLVGALALALGGCSQQPASPQPTRADQPMDPVATAAHIAAFDAASAAGDSNAARQHMDAFQRDMLQSMKIPDPSRPIDREAARAAVLGMPGVRGAVWVDHDNLLAMVDGNAMRSQATIDAICMTLEPLGDTLAVVVNLQNSAARTSAEQDTLSRNCRLAPGDRAWLQARRRMNAIDADLRARTQRDSAVLQADRRQPTAGDRAALEAIPER